MEHSGEQFLHQKNPKLHTSGSVEHEVRRRKRVETPLSHKPKEKIAAWLETTEGVHTRHHDDPEVFERIRKYYHQQYVIRPEDIPESYFENQRRMAREQGHGNIEITEEMRTQAAKVIMADQRSTLDPWVDYLSSRDSSSFPAWVKYWAFTGMQKLASFDKEKHVFATRDKSTVAPFPDLNREALGYVADALIKKMGGESGVAIDDPEFKKLLEGANFGKLYAWAIEKVTPASQELLSHVEGTWVKYPQGSDHMPLVASLQGHGTNWCTAGESTAAAQLSQGDFYVFYSLDAEGKPTIPRVAIRMEEDRIAEVRGVAGSDQNMDPYIMPVVQKKLEEFPDGNAYEKKTKDMKRLTEVDRKVKSGQSLAKDDLRFLYEIDASIEGFGYEKDPRIKEIQKTRDVRRDIATALDISPDQVSLTEEEALRGGVVYHYGDLDLYNLTSAKGLTLPQRVGGDLNLSDLRSAEGLTLPQRVGGDLQLRGLTSAEGLTLPQTVGRYLNLDSLTSAEGLTLPQTVGRGLYLQSLISAKGLTLPQRVGGYLDLGSLTSAEGLTLPQTMGGDLFLSSLTSAEGLTLPQTVGGYLYLGSLTSTEGLTLPQTVGGGVNIPQIPRKEKKRLQEKYPHLEFADK